MAKLPEFLKDYTVGPRHPLRKAPMSGWTTLHAWLVANKRNLRPADYARLMVIELEREEPRLQILIRLKGTFEVERRKIERRELMKSI